MIRVRFVGDAALRVDVDEGALLESNTRAQHLAHATRQQALPGVRDVVAAMTTVTVHLDPLRCDVDVIEAFLSEAAARPVEAPGLHGREHDVYVREHEVPVQYGGSNGPDLDAVARTVELSTHEVIARHTAILYRVCFLGFLPGFAYLGWLDRSLHLPRRDTPRTHVPAGSVAVAGVYTGIYPTDSPGGWHVIGRTRVPLFDPGRPSPALLAPGDLVRMVAA